MSMNCQSYLQCMSYYYDCQGNSTFIALLLYTDVMNVYLLILLLVIAVVFIAFLIAGIRGAVWVPVRSADLRRIIKHLQLSERSIVYEFGSGDGRFLRLVNRSGARAVGYDINPVMVGIARLLSYRSTVTLKVADAWSRSFTPATIVFVFLMPEHMERLSKKMKHELRPGTILVSYMFPVPHMDPYLHDANAYFYKIGA